MRRGRNKVPSGVVCLPGRADSMVRFGARAGCTFAEEHVTGVDVDEDGYESADSYAQKLAQQLEISYEQNEEIIVKRVIERFDIYNLITLSIWMVEIGTSIWLSSRNRDRLTWVQSIELCIALIYLLMDL